MVNDDPARSAQACPACGEHRLAVEPQERVDVMGVQPFGELLGMGDLQAPPAITCLACGTRWSDLKALRLDRREPSPAAGEDAPSQT